MVDGGIGGLGMQGGGGKIAANDGGEAGAGGEDSTRGSWGAE